MNIAEFKVLIADYMNRDVSLFTTGTDKIVQAVNNAKLHAQRMHNFEFARVPASVVVTKASGGDMSTAVLLGTATAVDVKLIERTFLKFGSSTAWQPVNFQSRNDQVKRAQRRYEQPRDYRVSNQAPTEPTGFYSVIQAGTVLQVYPWSDADLTATSTVVALDVVKWLEPYAEEVAAVQPAGTVATDFLMKYCTDWLMYRSIIELNYFLKEDQRVAISRGTMEITWKSVEDWDNAIISSKSDDNLLD